MDEHILVRSALPVAEDGSSRVALWERDPAHPDGECFVAGATPTLVGHTERVEELLRAGTLVRVETPVPATVETSAAGQTESAPSGE